MKKYNGFSMKLIMLLMCLSVALLSCTINAPEPADDDSSTTIEKKVESETEVESATETETSGGLPPLVIDSSDPLLLDEPDEETIAAANTVAAKENAACFVCHTNYRTEFLASCHAKANISCYRCHGESSAHQNDENNITPPETLYPAGKIDPLCRGCHKAHDLEPRDIIADWMKKKSENKNTSCEGCHESNDIQPGKVVARWKELALDKTDPKEIVCTDCHGDHRMKVRTIIWDKETGKLLSTNKGD